MRLLPQKINTIKRHTHAIFGSHAVVRKPIDHERLAFLSGVVSQEVALLLLVHEYIADAMLLVASFRTALARCALLQGTADRLTAEVNKLIATSRSSAQVAPIAGGN